MSESDVSQTHEGPVPEVPGGASSPAVPRDPAGTQSRRPRIGDTRPAPPVPAAAPAAVVAPVAPRSPQRPAVDPAQAGGATAPVDPARTGAPAGPEVNGDGDVAPGGRRSRSRRRGPGAQGPAGRALPDVCPRRARTTQIAVLEGRSLIEHYVSRPADDANQIDGNIYLGRVQNVLPGHGGGLRRHRHPEERRALPGRRALRPRRRRVERGDRRGRGGAAAPHRALLKVGQTIVCQVTKNPIGTKGARLTQEVSLPGRFVVLIPNSDTYGISKRLADDERKRLRRILDDVRPPGHGLIVRTAAEGATADELRRDVARLLEPVGRHRRAGQAVRGARPALPGARHGGAGHPRGVQQRLPGRRHRRPGAVRGGARLRASISPELADRVEYYDADGEGRCPIFERYHVHEQLHKALDRKVWLPSGGSLIIERTEALTVIDVNTGKNVGTSNLEETVFRNNLEAAEEIARQLRLRDIGGIIVIDFIDMEIAANRAEVAAAFRDALARDKTRTQVFDISELGLVEMTRKRISEGLVRVPVRPSAPVCDGPGLVTLGRLSVLCASRSPSYVCGDKDRWKAGAGRRGPASGRRAAGRGRRDRGHLRAGPARRRRHRAGRARPLAERLGGRPGGRRGARVRRSTASPTRTSPGPAVAGGVTASTTPRIEITGITAARRETADHEEPICRRPRVAVPPATAATPTPSASA